MLYSKALSRGRGGEAMKWRGSEVVRVILYPLKQPRSPKEYYYNY